VSRAADKVKRRTIAIKPPCGHIVAFDIVVCRHDEMRQQRLVGGTLSSSFSKVISLKINDLSSDVIDAASGNGIGSHIG
jgi:hypothetical protein